METTDLDPVGPRSSSAAIATAEADEPMDLMRGPQWPCRVALAPMTNQQSNADGSLGDAELTWLRSRSSGGFGAIVTCASHVSREGQAFPGQLGIFEDSLLPGLTAAAEAMKAHGSVALVQLHHGGRRALPDLTGLPSVAPWDDEDRGSRSLTTAEVERLVGDHVEAAVRAEAAGFDGVELHGAHGYLIAQFLSVSNVERDDQYGGSLENRARFLFEILHGIRASTGPQFQVGVRLGPEGGGTVVSEARAVVGDVMASGLVDFIDLSMGDVFKDPQEQEQEQEQGQEHAGRPLLDHFVGIPRHGVRLGAAGKVQSSDDVARALAAGIDFVLVGVAGVVHADFAVQVLRDRTFEAVTRSVGRDHLRDTGLSDAFIDYLDSGWKDLVAAPPS